MNARGFTLIEMLVCLAILAVLAVMTVPVLEVVAQRTKENELRIALRQMRNAIDAYKQASDEGRVEHKLGQSGYPPSLQVLVEGVADQKDPQHAMMYFLRRIPRDPMSEDSAQAPDRMWGLRAYSSSASDPQSGEDVFDVYSLSKGTGLNDVPDTEW